MNMKEYLEGSGRTTAKLDEVRKDMYPAHTKLAYDLVNLVVNGQTADLMKRGLFYKESIGRLGERAEGFKTDTTEMYELALAADTTRTFGEKEIDIIHAALGMFSEAGEILQEVVNAFLHNRPFDLTNLREEAGDILWYEALLLRSVDSDFETEGERNLNKLAKRYPEKFTSEAALNRDLEAEKQVLSA